VTPSLSTDRPPLPLYLTEGSRAAGEFGLYIAARPILGSLPKGDGHAVLIIPGMLGTDKSTRPLRAVLRRLGYRAHGWGLGRNIGPTTDSVDGMARRLFQLERRYGRSVSVIGWSLGGIFARRLGRERPQAVRQVITIASPFAITRDSQSRAQAAFRHYTHLHAEDFSIPLASEKEPLSVPATSIYSRLDGVVSWRACLDVPTSRSENIAVLSSHLGMGHHPATLYAVADRLAQPLDSWSPFRAPLALRPWFPKAAVPAERND
jgi:pimeloyl-ACP methyl ester carboxylesterase